MVKVIVLSGPIGAGKSSLTKILADHLQSDAFYEEVNNNPVLPLYYQDMKRYTFLLNTYFLNKRLEGINHASSNQNNVLDRSIYEDALFFNMNVDAGIADPTEYQIYRDLMANMMEDIPGSPKKQPDLLIYLHISLDTMLARIQKRGRSYEQLDQDPELRDYYQRLLSYYEPWYEQYDISPKIKIDGDKFDFVESAQDRAAVLQIIDDKLHELGNL